MKDFTAGVVEGFYGVPWTAEQKNILFEWMQKMGLNTYMYAPKNDYKHRAFWRDLYSVEEAENLTCLIDNAQEKGVTFVYAISPGLDISFSSTKDVQAMKRKLEQVYSFGCRAFALLFDDIDPTLSEADQSVFSSSACAQASLTNDIFEHLNQPKLMFCPTEYCTSRALPSVLTSEYLTTLGSKLLPAIDIMWTGCKVISKKITIQTLEDINTVLRRPPIIWDNIHANDYDPRRVFLGPYDGRSPEIIPYIRGVMTNPNCEFEANYIACHTLGQWSQSNPDAVKKDIIAQNRLSPVLSDIRLEMEGDSCLGELCPLDRRYSSVVALKAAVRDWLQELTSRRDPPKRTVPVNLLMAGPPDVTNAPDALTAQPTDALSTLATDTLTTLPSDLACCDAPSDLSSCDTASVDSGVELCPVAPSSPPCFAKPSEPQAVTDCASEVSDAASDLSSVVSDCCASEVEPMDCAPVCGSCLVVSNLNLLEQPVQDKLEQPLMQVSSTPSPPASPPHTQDCSIVPPPPSTAPLAPTSTVVVSPSLLTEQDVELLVGLFYLPFEHGSHSIQLLNRFQWLMDNATCLHTKQDLDKVGEWHEQLEQFEGQVQALDLLLVRMFVGPNKAVLCDLYAYIWDLKGVLSTCLAYAKWLKHGVPCNSATAQNSGFATWFSKGYREAFTSGDQEPWIFRGGLQAELQRLLPAFSAHDLFLIKTPDYVVQKLYSFRPYSPQDKSSVYDLCVKTCDEGLEGSDILTRFPELLGDRLIGNFLQCSPEFCFVGEDGESVCGYVVSAPDAKELASSSNQLWIPSMQAKYPQHHSTEEMVQSFHGEQLEVEWSVHQSYPSVVRLDVLVSRMLDPAVPRRLLACALCALKAVGSKGVHTKLNSADKFMMDFYSKLGFFAITPTTQPDTDVVYMGRLL